MTVESIIFLLIGGTFLWGGLVLAIFREFKSDKYK